jgi:alkylhydroperoxidase family enzyme
MSYNIPMTNYETADETVRREYDDQFAKHGRITNMKRTLLHSVPAFHAYMEWYTLKDLLVPFLGERGVSILSYAISKGNECLVCGTFFRKILTDAGTQPDNPNLSQEEDFLVRFGTAIAKDPHHIDDSVYAELSRRYSTEQQALLIAFAGIMAATNLFNTVAKVPLDENLYDYMPKPEDGQNG